MLDLAASVILGVIGGVGVGLLACWALGLDDD